MNADLEQHRLAAEQAMASTLWDEAAREYEAALSLIAAGDAANDAEPELLTALGTCYWNLSDARTAWRTLRRAIALCRDRGDGIGMARATAESLRIWGPPERQRAMADEALALLGDADPYLRALLLLRQGRYDENEAGFAEALALADQHGFEDLLTIRTDRQAWAAFDAGRIDEGLALMETAHETYARLNRYEQATGALRSAGYGTFEQGHLDRGASLASRALAYASSVHLRFMEQLALMDLAGEAFARCDFDRCRDLLVQSPGDLDFRVDLYRMWMAELAGDTEAAVRQIISPDRGGGATPARSQTHCANAGVLFHAGRLDAARRELDAARRELDAWLDVARQGNSICYELPPAFDCLIALGSDEALHEVEAALERSDALPGPMTYSTLQGRALAPARGAVALKLGNLDVAGRAYREGIAWCERERVPIDAAHCHVGLSDLARLREDKDTAGAHLERAASIYEAHGARLWLDQFIEPRALQ